MPQLPAIAGVELPMGTFEKEYTRYTYDVPVEAFIKMLRLEAGWPVKNLLSWRLNKLPGVFDTEYDGHFGARVFFSILEGHDTDATRALIEAEIYRALARATRQGGQRRETATKK